MSIKGHPDREIVIKDANNYVFFQPHGPVFTRSIPVGMERSDTLHDKDLWESFWLPRFREVRETAKTGAVKVKNIAVRDNNANMFLAVVFGPRIPPTADLDMLFSLIVEKRVKIYHRLPPDIEEDSYISIISFNADQGNIELPVDKDTVTLYDDENEWLIPRNEINLSRAPIPPQFLFKPMMSTLQAVHPALRQGTVVIEKDTLLYYVDGRPDAHATSWQLLRDRSQCTDPYEEYKLKHYPMHVNVPLQTRAPHVASAFSGVNTRAYHTVKDVSFPAINVFLFDNHKSRMIERDFADVVESIRMHLDAREIKEGDTSARREKIYTIVFWKNNIKNEDFGDLRLTQLTDATVVFVQTADQKYNNFKDIFPDNFALSASTVAKYNVLPGRSENTMTDNLVEQLLARSL